MFVLVQPVDMRSQLQAADLSALGWADLSPSLQSEVCEATSIFPYVPKPAGGMAQGHAEMPDHLLVNGASSEPENSSKPPNAIQKKPDVTAQVTAENKGHAQGGAMLANSQTMDPSQSDQGSAQNHKINLQPSAGTKSRSALAADKDHYATPASKDNMVGVHDRQEGLNLQFEAECSHAPQGAATCTQESSNVVPQMVSVADNGGARSLVQTGPAAQPVLAQGQASQDPHPMCSTELPSMTGREAKISAMVAQPAAESLPWAVPVRPATVQSSADAQPGRGWHGSRKGKRKAKISTAAASQPMSMQVKLQKPSPHLPEAAAMKLAQQLADLAKSCRAAQAGASTADMLRGRRVAFVLPEDYRRADPAGHLDVVSAGLQTGQYVLHA